MKSTHFEFLREKWPELASLGGFAEQYAWPDPESARVKLRAYAEAIAARFVGFAARHPGLSATQISFLNLLKNHISRYGSIEIEALYEHPFTILHSDGLDGVFTDEHVAEELLAVIATFQPDTTKNGDRRTSDHI